MRNSFSSFFLLIAMNVCALPVTAAEPGWRIDQNTNANGNQLVVVTPRAIEITLPHQKYKVYSAAPNWSVIYINNQIGTYMEFPHDQFMGSIIGRLGNHLGNDIQILSLPPPAVVKEGGLEYATYDYALNVTADERRQLKIKGSATVLYNPRSIRARYLRMPNIPTQAKELICKLCCVPMSTDFPISFSCIDGFKKSLTVLSTTLKRQEKAVTITPPDLKSLKRVKTEQELFSRSRLSDVFELFGDAPDKK
ncbi:MAG: hypothetical protein C0469_07950 [Cyanobacteria bacterium DS2.3.42]|nr:hypothetical protein [Cyanobacteria bacterium DS2.3.42]